MGLCCCTWAFFSCDGWELLSRCGAQASRFGGFSCCGARAQGSGLQWLWQRGLVAPWHVGSSWTRDQTCVSCIGRQILKQESPKSSFFTHRLSLSHAHRWTDLSHSTYCLQSTFFWLLDDAISFFITTSSWPSFTLKCSLAYYSWHEQSNWGYLEWFNQCGLWHWR